MICGIDEAGRGPLAGPVCAAAVILNDDFPISVLNDSKKLKAEEREKSAILIRERALALGVGWASHLEIDKINILQASLTAMRRAFEALLESCTEKSYDIAELITSIIVDGTYTPDISLACKAIPCKAMIKADGKIHAVMAASIIAKTERDREMLRLAALYPEYKYEKHKGYPTKEHKELIAKHGPSPIQRLTFRSSLGQR